MTVNDLDKKLTNSLIEYSETIRTMYEEADRTSATKMIFILLQEKLSTLWITSSTKSLIT